MSCPARDEQFEVFVGSLEKSLSSAKWGDLADSLHKAAKIFRILQGLSTSFPSLEASNDALHQNANCILASNIGAIGTIFQLCANSFPEFDTICSKFAKFLPELKTVASLPSYAKILKFKPDRKSAQNLTSYLRNIINAMDYIHQILPFFKIALFACNEPVFSTQEFAKASSEFTDLVEMLEMEYIATCKQMSGNSFLKVFFHTLDRPFKIVTSALRLLFTSPLIENLKFDAILGLCHSAVSLFVCAVGMMKDLTQFLSKDFVMLKVVNDESLKKFQLVTEYCKQILELKPSDASVFKELEHGENYVILNNTICESVDMSDETQENSASKSAVSPNDTHTGTTNKSQEASAVERTGHTKDSENVCNVNFHTLDTSEETLQISALKSTVEVNDVSSVCVDIFEESQRASPQRSAVNVSTISTNFLDQNLEIIVFYSEETQATFPPKSSVQAKDINDTSLAISEKIQTTSAPKSAMNVEDRNCESVFEETQKNFVLRPSEKVEDANCLSVITSSKTPITSALESTTVNMKTNCNSPAKETQETVTLKSVEVEDTNCTSFPAFPESPSNSVSKLMVKGENTNFDSVPVKTQETIASKPSARGKSGKCSAAATSKERPRRGKSGKRSAKRSAAATFKETPRRGKSGKCSAVATPEETPSNTALNSSVNMEGTNNDSVCKDTHQTFAPKSSLILKDTNCTSFSTSKDTSTNSAPQHIAEDTNCDSVSKETPETLAVKSSVKEKDTDRSTEATSNETPSNSALKSVVNLKDTNHDHVFNDTQETFTPISSRKLKDPNGVSFAAFQETPSNAAPKSMVNVKDTNCGVSEKTRKTSASKKSVKVKVAKFSAVAASKETPSNLTLKSSMNVEETNCDSVSKEKLETFEVKPLVGAKDTSCTSVAVSKKVYKTFALKTSAKVKDANHASIATIKQTQNTFTPKSSASAKYTNRATVANAKEVPKKPKTSLPKPVMNMEDTNYDSISEKTSTVLKSVKKEKSSCSNLATSKENPKLLTPNLTVKAKNTICSGVTTSGIRQQIVVKPSAKLKNTEHSSVATCKKTQGTFEQKSSVKVENTKCCSVATLKEMPTTSAVKPTLNADSVTVCEDSRVANVFCANSPFLDLIDIEFHLLTSKQRKTLDKVIRSYNQRVNELSFSVKIAESEFQVLCKICGQTLLAENVEKHLNDECQSQNLSTRSNYSQETPEAMPVSHTPSTSTIQCGPAVWFLDITDVEFDSLRPKHRNVLEKLIEKINYHTNHFSFAVKVIESELVAVWCKCCDATFPPESIEEHIEDLIHKRSVYELCKRCPETRAALPQIGAENWKFLDLAPGGRHMCWCGLCGQSFSLSVNAWIQHFQSFWHRQELKKLNDLSKPGISEISGGRLSPEKVRLRAEKHQPVNLWGGKRVSAKVPPYLKTSPANGEIFGKLFGAGKMEAPVSGQDTANLWSPKSIRPNFPPYSMTSPAQGGIFSKLVAPKDWQNQAGGSGTGRFNSRIAPYKKPKMSTPSESQRDAFSYWNQFSYHMQNIMHSTLPSTFSNPAESFSQPANGSQSGSASSGRNL